MNEFVMKLRILMRAEMTLFKADAQRRTNTAMMTALAIGCVLVALVFVNVGAFFALTESDIDSKAAFILAAANMAVATVPFLLSRRAKPGPEEQMVREIREMALTEISKDVEGVAKQISSGSIRSQELSNNLLLATEIGMILQEQVNNRALPVK